MTQPTEIRQAYPCHMHDAILAQPQAIARMLAEHDRPAREIAAAMAGRRRLYLVGVGASWHAALTAEYWFRRLAGDAPAVRGWHSCGFCAYPPPLGAQDTVVIISHRGTKTDSFRALELSVEKGALTVVVTAANSGPRRRLADFSLPTVAQERSAAFTFGCAAVLTVLALLACCTGDALANRSRSDLNPATLRAQPEPAPAVVADIIDRRQQIERTAQGFAGLERFVFVGWGPNMANACGAALKIEESSAADCEGFQAEQLLHGPLCAVDERCPITLIGPPGPGARRARDSARAAAAAGTSGWALTQQGDAQLAGRPSESSTVPPIPELRSPLACVIPLQLFAGYLTLARKRNPQPFQQDYPRQAAARPL